jgi:hypothetical protein
MAKDLRRGHTGSALLRCNTTLGYIGRYNKLADINLDRVTAAKG